MKQRKKPLTTKELQRIFSKVKVDELKCWTWKGNTTFGYGYVWLHGKQVRVHKILWEHDNGLTPEGKELDHLCQNRACVNPKHLEPVSHQTNVLRGTSPAASNAQKTHCKHGHPFTAANTFVYEYKGRKKRACRACRRLTSRESARRRVGYYEHCPA